MNRAKRLSAAVAAVSASSAGLAMAAPSIYYNATGTNSWNTLSNWKTDAAGTSQALSIPQTTDTVGIGTTAVTGPTIINLDASQVIAGLQLGGTAATMGATTIQTGTGTNTLTIGSGGILVTGTVTAVQTISAGVILGDNQTWTSSGSNAQLTLSGNVTGGKNVIIAGSKVVQLSGTANAIGDITVNGGASLTMSQSTGTNSIGNLVVNGTLNASAVGINASDSTKSLSFGSGATFGAQSGPISTAKAISITNVFNFYTNNRAITLNGAITAATTGTLNVIGDNTSSLGGSADNTNMAFTLNGAAGNWTLAKTSSSTVHAVNGTLTVQAGKVTLGGTGGDQIKDTAAVVLTGGNLDLAGNSETIGALSGTSTSSTISNSSATSATLTSSAASGSTAYAGKIQNGTGTVSFVKSGGSTLLLSGSNSYTGGTTVAGGILNVGNTSTLGSGGVSVADGATLNFQNSGTQLSVNSATAVASNAVQAASRGFDGNTATRWETAAADPQWIYVDLGSSKTINNVQIYWEAASAKNFQIQVAPDAGAPGAPNTGNWTSALSVTNGNPTPDVFTNYILPSNTTGRYIAMYGTARTTGYGYSFYEMQMYGLASAMSQTIGSLSSASSNATVSLGDLLTLNLGSDNSSTTYAGKLTGLGSVQKTGSGTFMLTGTNSDYSGGTVVSNGTLSVNNIGGSATGTGAVTINSGAKLSGGLGAADAAIPANGVYASSTKGIISGAVSINSGGHLAPGNSVGTLTVGSLSLSSGSILDWEFNGTANDLTAVTSTNGLSITGGAFNFYQEGTTNPFGTNGLYHLINYKGAIGGTGISALSISSLASGKTGSFSTSSDGAGGFYLDLTIANEQTNVAQLLAAGTKPNSSATGSVNITGTDPNYKLGNTAIVGGALAGHVDVTGALTGQPIFVLLDINGTTDTLAQRDAVVSALMTAGISSQNISDSTTAFGSILNRYQYAADYDIVLRFTSAFPTGSFQFDYDLTNISGVTSLSNVGIVPEPATLSIVGFAGLAALRSGRSRRIRR